MKSVGIVYDQMTTDVQAQIVRDFLILSCEFDDLGYLDPSGQVDTSIMEELGVPKGVGIPELYIVYKTGKVWPTTDRSVERVERDLSPPNANITLSGEPRIGYYLKEQGRPGANLTERYLNRSHPQGRGFVSQWMLHMWG